MSADRGRGHQFWPESACRTGGRSDLIVVGNALEKDPELLIDIAEKVYEWNRQER
jgi:heptaprenylglyceryl phosphate synthase